MSSDRFGEIRIKPDADKTSRDESDVAPHNRIEEIRPPDPQQEDTVFQHAATREKYRMQLPFKPGRALLWVAVPLFLVLLYGVGSYFLVPSLVKGPLSKNLSESLGRPVTVNRVVFSPFTLRVFLKTVAVGPVYGDMNKQNLLECSDFYCRIDFLGLFNRHLICHEVKINGVALNLVRLRLGSFNIADAANFFSLIKGRSGQVFWPAWLVLDGVLLTDGRVIIDDSLAKKQHRIEQIRFYFPAAEEAKGNEDATPRLNAVINESPVQIDGRRQKNMQGEMETRFNLKFSEIVLKNYLDYLPALQQNPFHLAEGQADINVDFVIPELNGGARKVTIQWNAAIKALRFVNKNSQTLLKVPEALIAVQAVPSENQYILKKAEFNKPEFTISLNNQTDQYQPGLTVSELKNFIKGLDKYPHGIRIENFSLNDGKLSVFRGKQKSPRYTWEKGQLRLTGFFNQSARENEKVMPPPAAFWISSSEKTAAGTTELKTEGKFQASAKFEGQLSVNNIDLSKYSVFLPEGTQFAKGQADLEGLYSYAIGSNDSNDSNDVPFQLRNGSLTISNYILRRDKEVVLSGNEMTCQNMQVDVSVKEFSCENVSLVKSSIDADRISLAEFAKNKSNDGHWALWAQNLTILDSQLHRHFINPFEQDKPVYVEFNDVSLQAVNLQGDDHKSNNLKASAVIGRKGTLSLNGSYSLVSGKGQFLTTLNDVQLLFFKDYFFPWFIPEIRDGKINVEGTYKIPEKEFTGKVSVENLRAGQEKEPSLEWKEGVSETLKLKFEPFTFHCDEIQISQFSVTFGLSHAAKPVTLFFRPVKEKNAQNSSTIQTIRFDKGTFALAEPVVSQGYQPKLSDLSGAISSIGSDTMDFLVQGTVDEQGSFSVSGMTGMREINNYKLDVIDVPLGPFQSLLAGNIGVDVKNAKGSWQQEMRRSAAGYNVASRIQLYDIVPDPDSAYFKIIALYTDENGSLRFSSEESYQKNTDHLFLFDLFARGIKHDAVRADLSEQLVLKKLLPELNLPDRVEFVPGTFSFASSRDLSDYVILFKKRPFLRLELFGNFDQQQDTEALKSILQHEEDAQREAENRRRTEEKRKIVEHEKARLAELEKDPKQVVEEKISPVELLQDLQPLPYREVRVEPDMLLTLAKKRTEVLYDYFVKQLAVAPEKVHIQLKTGKSGPQVNILVQPSFALPAKEKEIGRNDSSIN